MTRPVALVAEDSVVVRTLLNRQLSARGYEVVEALDGEEAMARIREVQPDIVLLDIEMPRVDGLEVLARMKADADLRHIPVVFITGRTSPDDAIRGLELGAIDYLRKPFDPGELAARVDAAVRTKRLQDQLRTANEVLRTLAGTDHLTGLPNRRALDEQLARLTSRAARHGRPLALLMVDLDRFGRVNDEHGHSTGDEALVAASRRLADRLRAEDVLGRWGGAQFMIIAGDTDAAGARVLAQALCEAIAARPLATRAAPIAITVSIGVAMWTGDGIDSLLRRADQALYGAKRSGRNRAQMAPAA